MPILAASRGLEPFEQLLVELRRFTRRDDFADDLTLVAVSPRRE